MKITIFTGSGHLRSRCFKLAQKQSSYLRREGFIDVSIVDAAQIKVHACLGCDYCLAHQNECIIHDEMQDIYKMFRESDKLVFIIPVYFSNIPAGLKCVIDRCQLFYNLKDKDDIKPKDCLIVCLGGAPAYEGQFDAISLTFKVLLPDVKAKIVDFIEIPNCDKIDVLNDSQALDQVRNGINRLFEAGED